MRLEEIARIVSPTSAVAAMDVEITGVAYDSRCVRPGFLFAALPGRRENGIHFIDDALKRGAAAVMGESPLALRHVPYLRVTDARRALADASCAFFGNPADRLRVYGITGTNGKTTTAFLLRFLLQQHGWHPGLISTVRYEVGDRIIPAVRTTPEAPDLQAVLQRMERAGCDGIVMEVSSHALDQQRIRGIDYDVAIFTNLTRDHLDYHGSMDAYFEAKRRLFLELGRDRKTATAVINVDDPHGAQLLRDVQEGPADCLTYGVQQPADILACSLSLSSGGVRFLLQTPWGERDISSPLLGRFNVYNILAAVAAGGRQGIPLDTMVEALGRTPPVPGRLEQVSSNTRVKVYVDYAHTDDALSNVLGILREIEQGRILLVFGCGGDRDRSKRPVMGAVAEQGADHVFLTSDNPRSEDPAIIAEEIAGGFRDTTRYTIQLDRVTAIQEAIASALPGDTVLIAGKGHETYQEYKQTIVPFDDVEVARRFLDA